MTDEIVKLILDLASSSKDVSELVTKLGELQAKTNAVADSYQVLDTRTATYAVNTRQVATAEDLAVEAAVEHTRAQKALNTVLEQTAISQEKLGGVSRDTQMRILNLGRAAQDLVQGGFGGIINNIEGIVGGGGIAAGILTGIGTAALLATPYIKEWVKSLGQAGEKIPEATDQMQKYTDAINKNKKELEDLKTKQELTYFELLRYKDLVTETTRLEEEQATAREARAVGLGADKKSRERGAAVKETIAERFETSQELIDTIMGTVTGQQLGLKRIEEVMAGAQKGIGTDVASLKNISPQFKEAYEQFSPEGKAQVKQAQDNLKKEQEFQAKREKAVKERDALDEDIAKTQQHAREEAKQAAKTQFREFLREGRAGAQLQKGMATEQGQVAKRQAAQQQAEEIRGVQREGAEQGFNLSGQEAAQIVQQRKAAQQELQKAMAEGMGAMLGGQGDIQSQIQMWRQFGQQVQQQRAQASNGFPN